MPACRHSIGGHQLRSHQHRPGRRATSPCTPQLPPSQVVATPCAGIYYPPGSLKAKLCMEGRGRLYEYCRERNVPHKQLGKLLVATEEDEVHRLPTVL